MRDARAFLLRPLEPLFFGPPASFTAGDVLSATTRFPPSPWAFQGLVRSRLLAGAEPPLDLRSRSAQARERIADLVGGPDHLPSGWRLLGPLPAQWTDEEGHYLPWLPAPRYLLLTDKEKMTCEVARQIEPRQEGCSDLAPQGEKLLLGLPRNPGARPLGGWLSASEMLRILKGTPTLKRNESSEKTRRDRLLLPPFVHEERQVGLAIHRDERSARSGLIYNRTSLRFEFRCGLLGWLAGHIDPPLHPSALTHGTLPAGRGGRKVAFEPVPALAPDWYELVDGEYLPAELDVGARFWLVATAPVYIGTGSVAQPEMRADLPRDVTCEIVAALCGDPLVVGGYSIARGASRDNHVYAPPGSVWLCQLNGGDPASRAAALRAFHHRSPLGRRDEAPFGFGHCLVGLTPA